MPNKISAIFKFKCPRCRRGDLFPYSMFSKKLAQMNKRCAHCNQNFEPEPGFYFGAAYVSYGLTIGLWVALWAALATLDVIGLINFAIFDDMWFFLFTGLILLVITLPYLFRLSRALWIHMFVKYDREVAKGK